MEVVRTIYFRVRFNALDSSLLRVFVEERSFPRLLSLRRNECSQEQPSIFPSRKYRACSSVRRVSRRSTDPFPAINYCFLKNIRPLRPFLRRFSKFSLAPPFIAHLKTNHELLLHTNEEKGFNK